MKINSHIYKSRKKQDTYVYLGKKDDFECLPLELTKLLGKLEFVMTLELDNQRHLAQADVVNVIKDIQNSGYYIQLPKDLSASISQYSITG